MSYPLLLASALLGFWLYALGVMIYTRRYMPVLVPGTPPSLPDAAPKVSIVLPCRNETANIERCVRSLLALDYPHLEVLVVDDRSEDDTLAKARAMAERDARLTVIAGAELPEGWKGKNWANHQGVQRATGEYYLFTDADTEHGPESLRLAMQYLLASPYEAVTLLLLMECGSFWERVVQPAVVSFLSLALPSFLVNNPRSKASLGNGQYLLMSLKAYRGFGGHEGIRHHIVDDKWIAEGLKKAGFIMPALDATRVGSVRMYTDLRSIWYGWSKNFYEGLNKNLPALALMSTVIFLTGVAPYLLAAYGHLSGNGPLFWVSLLTVGLISYVRGYSARLFRLAPFWGWLHPLASLIVIGIMSHSAYCGISGAGALWKGRRLQAETARANG